MYFICGDDMILGKKNEIALVNVGCSLMLGGVFCLTLFACLEKNSESVDTSESRNDLLY